MHFLYFIELNNKAMQALDTAERSIGRRNNPGHSVTMLEGMCLIIKALADRAAAIQVAFFPKKIDVCDVCVVAHAWDAHFLLCLFLGA